MNSLIDILEFIDTTLGFPIVLFYSLTGIMLWIHYQKALGWKLGFAYSACVVSANSCVWEAPLFIRLLDFGLNFWVGFIALFPLLLALKMFKIEIKPYDHTQSIVIWWVLMEALYLIIAPMNTPDFATGVNEYNVGSLAYMSTFIPRSVSIIMLYKLLDPEAPR